MGKNRNSRTMVKYHDTKSDPICKWRNASVKTLVELVSWLPKERMSKEKFREYMNENYDGNFFHTPYQLAVQLALYYEDEKEYIPRFDHDITEQEATAYMHRWIKLYYVPNPFTKRGFVGICSPINLLYSFVDYLIDHPTKSNLATAGAALFGGEMGNLGNVKFLLNEYSGIIRVDSNNEMTLLKKNKESLNVSYNRNDKKAFFNHFNQ